MTVHVSRFLIGCIFTLSTCFSLHAFAKDLGTVGKTYSVLEPDAIEEIKKKVQKSNWQERISQEDWKSKMRKFKPAELKLLPRARKDDIRLVSMDYTLDRDIPDGYGGILYPKGFTFNPLDYISYPKTIIVFNGGDREQVDWFIKSSYAVNLMNTMVLITDGDYYDLSRELGQPVFFLDARVLDRFQLHAVPSVIRQKGKFMEVSEIDIEHQITINGSSR